MGSFRDDLLADVDDIRAIPGEFGVHRFRVFVRRTVTDGPRPGLGSQSLHETELLVGGQPPHVAQVQSKDLVAGAAALKSAMFDVGPLTANASDNTDLIDPPRQGTTAATTLYRITGPGLPTGGLLCQRIDDTTDKPFRYMIRIKATGVSST